MGASPTLPRMARDCTSIGVGGPILKWWPVRTGADVARALRCATDEALPWWVLGGGSNVVVSDAGLPGVVLHPVAPRQPVTRLAETAQTQTIDVAAGMPWDNLVAWAIRRDLQGIECLSGIPGQVGAAPIQNIGAYGQEFSEVAVSVQAYDGRTGTVATLAADQCGFSYRDSQFKREAGRWIVLAVRLRLRQGAPPCLRYPQLAQALADQVPVNLAQVRAAVLALRRSKSMVIDPADPDSRSCGSFFTNPLLPLAEAQQVVARLAHPGETAALWPQPDGTAKVSAAWLIERSGFGKGAGQGPVGLSRNHTLALVNRGSATAADVRAFAELVRQTVHARCGIWLVQEPVALGLA